MEASPLTKQRLEAKLDAARGMPEAQRKEMRLMNVDTVSIMVTGDWW